MAIVLTFSKIIHIICAYGPQTGRPDTKKVSFYDETMEVLVKSAFLQGISLEIRENELRILKVYMGEWYWEKKCRRILLEFCDKKKSCVLQTLCFVRQKKENHI